MAFSTVWSFGNILNGFVYFNGVQVIFSWLLMFALYFIPYALMVGEMGSAFKATGGGVSGWLYETTGPKLAYYAGWTYWAPTSSACSRSVRSRRSVLCSWRWASAPHPIPTRADWVTWLRCSTSSPTPCSRRCCSSAPVMQDRLQGKQG